MSDTTIPPTPAPEVAALVGKVHALSKLALEMTKLTMEINEAIPEVVASQVDAALAELTPDGPLWVHGTARTPDEIDALFPPGVGDNQSWYVVLVGREPGLYGGSGEADAQVNGVSGQSRRRKASRREALDYYRHEYDQGHVDKVFEAPATA